MSTSKNSRKVLQQHDENIAKVNNLCNEFCATEFEPSSDIENKYRPELMHETPKKKSSNNLNQYFKSIPNFDLGMLNVKDSIQTAHSKEITGKKFNPSNHVTSTNNKQESTVNDQQNKSRNKSAISKANTNNFLSQRKSSLNKEKTHKHNQYKDFINNYLKKDKKKLTTGMYLQGKNFDGIVKRFETAESDTNLLKDSTKEVIKNYDKFYISRDIKNASFDYNIHESSCDELLKNPPKKINTTSYKKKDLIKFEIDENSKNILEDFQNITIQNIQSYPEGDYFCFYNIDETEKLMKHINNLRNNMYCILKDIEKYLKDGRKAIHIKRTREGYYKNPDSKLILVVLEKILAQI